MTYSVIYVSCACLMHCRLPHIPILRKSKGTRISEHACSPILFEERLGEKAGAFVLNIYSDSRTRAYTNATSNICSTPAQEESKYDLQYYSLMRI